MYKFKDIPTCYICGTDEKEDALFSISQNKYICEDCLNGIMEEEEE